jgi:outer membrane protein assembly factor BamB
MVGTDKSEIRNSKSKTNPKFKPGKMFQPQSSASFRAFGLRIWNLFRLSTLRSTRRQQSIRTGCGEGQICANRAKATEDGSDLGFRTFCWLAVAIFFCTSAFADERTVTNRWLVQLSSVTDSSPAVGPDGTIYIGTFLHKLWAINPGGTSKWSFEAGSEIWSSPAVSRDSTAYFGCRDRKLYAVGANGREKWSFKTGAWVDSSPALAEDGTVYVGSWDKSLYALGADGDRKWQFETGGPVVSSPAIGGDGTVYFGSHDGKFYALLPTGNKKWEFATGGPIISSPAVNGDTCLYITSVDGFLYALNLDGTLRFKLKTAGATQSSPVIAADGMIFVGVNQELWEITAEGRLVWTRGMSCPVEAAPMALADSSVCVLCRWGFIACLDRERNQKWGTFLYNYSYNSPGIGTDGTVYAPRDGSYLAALPAGVPLAKSPWPKFRGNMANTGNVKDGPVK